MKMWLIPVESEVFRSGEGETAAVVPGTGDVIGMFFPAELKRMFQ
jgi:hypothetical protein